MRDWKLLKMIIQKKSERKKGKKRLLIVSTKVLRIDNFQTGDFYNYRIILSISVKTIREKYPDRLRKLQLKTHKSQKKRDLIILGWQ